MDARLFRILGCCLVQTVGPWHAAAVEECLYGVTQKQSGSFSKKEPEEKDGFVCVSLSEGWSPSKFASFLSRLKEKKTLNIMQWPDNNGIRFVFVSI